MAHIYRLKDEHKDFVMSDYILLWVISKNNIDLDDMKDYYNLHEKFGHSYDNCQKSHNRLKNV